MGRTPRPPPDREGRHAGHPDPTRRRGRAPLRGGAGAQGRELRVADPGEPAGPRGGGLRRPSRGDRRGTPPHLRRPLRTVPPPRLVPGRAGDRAPRHGGDPRLQHPEMVEAHFAVPMLGAVLNPLNTRLDPATIAFSLKHGGARVLIVEDAHAPLAARALAGMDAPPLVVAIGESGIADALPYEGLIAAGDPVYAWSPPEDEWQSLCLLYTSGTTGDPKGAVYSHRGAYLQALGNAVTFGLTGESVARCDASVRRAHRPVDDRPRPRPGAAELFPDCALRGGRSGTLVHHHPHDGGDGLPHHPSLRGDGELWPGDRLPRPTRLGRPDRRGALPAHGPAGRGAGDPRCRDRPRPRDRRAGAAGWQPDRRDRPARQHDHERLSRQPVGHREGPGQWLVRHGRPRRLARGRGGRDQGPLEGHHHLRRREHLQPGGGRGADAPPCGDAGGRGRPARRDLGRDALRLPRSQARQRGAGPGRDHCLLPGADGPLQGAEDGAVRPPAENLHRQDPEVHSPGAGAGVGLRVNPSPSPGDIRSSGRRSCRYPRAGRCGR
ncbi:hypothetical protein Lal_00041280 [Lupinus albus]|nr:hypothetical protein Lal_00041280 [Lupinus albus]